jgi:multiple sugar transport system substrate-binding protein
MHIAFDYQVEERRNMSETQSTFNKKTRLVTSLTTFAALSLLVTACAAPAAPAPAPNVPAAATEVTEATPAATAAAPATEEAKPTEAAAAPAGEAQDFVTWYQYDEKNEDTQSDERVGNAYLRETIPLFNEAFKGKWNWINQAQPFDKMATSLVAAVQAGGEVPDLMQAGNDEILKFYKNGTLEDLTEWAQAQTWFKDLDSTGVQQCTGPDGKLYCIPIAQTPQLVFYWTAHYPDGFPKTQAEFMTQAEALKAKNVYAITFFGSTAFDGLGTERFIWTAVSSFGGTFDDGSGKMTLNTPENVKAIEWMREIVQKEYAHPRSFDGTQTPFIEEEPMKTAEAASFPTGIFGYRYVNPLKSPSGKEYNTKTEQDMLDAIAAGDVALSPFFTPDGSTKPGCGIGVTGFVIPKGAKNMEAAHDYINWVMSPEQNAKWVQGPGGGFPSLKVTLEDAAFKTPFFEQAAKVSADSACRPWYGSLDRKDEAQKTIMTAVYKLIKEDPSADIAATLTAAEGEYNQGG